LDGKNNLYSKIQLQVITYFENNDIAWWGDDNKYPTGHLLSSQIQCLNFLFALRNDKNAILKLARLFDEEFDDILPTIIDKEEGYISFEFIYENEKLLNEIEEGAKRGEFCTSIDAFIIGLKKDKKVLIPIEWKFTESYLKCENKALELNKGKTRQDRYNHIIQQSKQLKRTENPEYSTYIMNHSMS